MKSKIILLVLVIFLQVSSTVKANSLENFLETDLPDYVMAEVVRKILISEIKAAASEKTVYLYEKQIKEKWLPEITNIEFELLSDEEIKKLNKKVYFFTEIENKNGKYEIGFAFGDPNCSYEGKFWEFHVLEDFVQIWQSGFGFGGGCSSGSAGKLINS